MAIPREQYTGATDSELHHFLKEHCNTDARLQLLRFWGQHPRTKFNLPCFAAALDTKRFNLKEVIKVLVDEEIIQEQHNSNGITWYSLVSDQQIQKYITRLAELDWCEIKFWKKQCVEEIALAYA